MPNIETHESDTSTMLTKYVLIITLHVYFFFFFFNVSIIVYRCYVLCILLYVYICTHIVTRKSNMSGSGVIYYISINISVYSCTLMSLNKINPNNNIDRVTITIKHVHRSHVSYTVGLCLSCIWIYSCIFACNLIYRDQIILLQFRLLSILLLCCFKTIIGLVSTDQRSNRMTKGQTEWPVEKYMKYVSIYSINNFNTTFIVLIIL